MQFVQSCAGLRRSPSHRRTTKPRRLPARRPLYLELLEDRLAPSNNTLATARLLPFDANSQTQVSAEITSSSDVQIFQVQLDSDSTLTARVDAQSRASSLDSYLRIFNASGQQLA